MKNKKKWIILLIGCVILCALVIQDARTKNNADYTFVIATSDKFYDETYRKLEEFFQKFGIDQDGDGKVEVALDRLSVQTDMKTGEVANSYEDGIQLLKMMTEIKVLERNVYILDTKILKLLEHYNDKFFENVIAMSEIAEKDKGMEFDKAVLNDYWICIRSRDTFDKLNEMDYKKYEKYIQNFMK